MNWKDILLRIRALLFRRQVDEELEEELHFHLEMQSRKNSSREPDKLEAKRLARLQFGNLTRVTERCREMRGISWLEVLARDLRFSFRSLRKSPGFSSIVILTMALGIGGNTAIFSIVNSVLLRPLPFPEPNRLVAIYTYTSTEGNTSFSYPDFLDWQRDNSSFAYLAVYLRSGVALLDSGSAEYLQGELISANFFDALGVKPLLGRTFVTDEDHLGGRRVVLLSESFWRRKYGAMPTIVGQSIVLDGIVHTVAGVIPANFSFDGNLYVSADVYQPIGQSTDWTLRDRKVTFEHGIGRLKQGVTLEQARRDMDAVARHLAAQYPDADKDNGVALIPLQGDITHETVTPLYILLGAVGFVLLISCANNANLLLARSTARMREFAVRSALGASKGRCIRQLLSESVMLSLAGGLLGLLLAVCTSVAAQRFLPGKIPRASEIHLDARVLFFSLGLSLLCGILFGLAPALRIPNTSLHDVFKEGGRGTIGGRNRLQRVFVIAEMALALVLLAGAGLMLQTLSRLASVNPGFNPHKVLNFGVTFPAAFDSEPPTALREHLREITKNLESIRGVVAASMVDAGLPMQGDDELPFWLDGEPRPPSVNDMHWADDMGVEPGFARAMQIPVLRGRFISEQDTPRSLQVVVIDELLARKYFPHVDPIGKKLNTSIMNTRWEIVGIVGHVKRSGLAEKDNDGMPQVYYASRQAPDAFLALYVANMGARYVVRTRGEPLLMVSTIDGVLKKINAQQTVYGAHTLESIVSDSMASQRFTMQLLVAFAVLAVLLASIGVYGVVSYVVGQRNREIGLRIALGATRPDVLALVFKEGILIGGLGVSIGIVATMGMTRLLAKLLFGISAHDPLTFAGATILLVLVALCATCSPAVRAMRLDPVTALRHE